MTTSSGDITIRGHGSRFFLAALFLTFVTFAIPVLLIQVGHPPSMANVYKIWIIVCCIDVFLLPVSAYFRSRRLTLKDGELQWVTWFQNKKVPIHDITEVTYQKDPYKSNNPNLNYENYLVLWKEKEKLTQINVWGWSEDDLRKFFQAVRAQNPNLKIAADAAYLFAA